MAIKQQQQAALSDTISLLCDHAQRLLARQQASHPDRRVLIALAGVPGSGKSTISAALLDALSSRGIDDVVVVPMDGFHYPKAALAAMPDPALAFRRRGAPFTFDAAGFLDLVSALGSAPVTRADDPGLAVRAPSFDHALQDPVAAGIRVPSTARLVVVEGNYTLLDEAPWSRIAGMVDERWFVDVPAETARERLVARHLLAGIESCGETAAARAEDNDIPNGDLIRSKLIKPDVRILN